MKKAFILVIILFGVLNSGLIKQSKDIKISGKPIMFLFTSKSCPYCERLKSDLSEVDFLNKIAKDFRYL